MNVLVIDRAYELYAGHAGVTISMLIDSNIQLMMSDGLRTIGMHLTSDPEYMQWLITRADVLCIHGEHCWYSEHYYNEYNNVFTKLTNKYNELINN